MMLHYHYSAPAGPPLDVIAEAYESNAIQVSWLVSV